MDFGRGPLSQPLLVEAFDEEFVPVLVFNNKTGRDDELRERFREPAWNNPVVRFLAADGSDVIPRQDAIWTTPAVAARLVDALQAAQRPVPAWLAAVTEELATKRATALLTMYCYWEGEALFGELPGVLATTAVDLPAAVTGTGKGEEGVKIEYDAAQLPRERLIAAWKTLACANRDLSDDARALAAAAPAQPSDRKHALRATPWWRVPMTPRQQTRANAAVAHGKDPLAELSPRQQRLARRIADASVGARTALEQLEPAESLEAFAGYEAKVARLFTQVGG